MSELSFDRSCKLCRPAARFFIKKAKSVPGNIFLNTEICDDCVPLCESYLRAAYGKAAPRNPGPAYPTLGDACIICDLMVSLHDKCSSRVKEKQPFCNSCKKWMSTGFRQEYGQN